MSIAARLDRLPLSPFHWLMLGLSGGAWAFNALNSGIISFVFPLVKDEWKLEPQQLGLTGSVQMVGMMLGAATVGRLSDRYGRKTTMQLTLALLCIATGIAGLSWDFWSLTSMRFVASLGMGGMLPVATTLMTEFSPSRYRGTLIVALDSFYAWGSILASVVAFLLIPTWGWRASLFFGAIPVLFVLAINRWALESPRYLLDRGRRREAENLVRWVEARCGVASSVAAKDERLGHETVVAVGPRVTFGYLWSRQLRKTTICCSMLNFAMVYSYYGIFLWFPTLLVAAGHDIARSFEFIIIMNVAQLPGYFVAGYLVEKTGRKWTLCSAFLLCAVATYMLGGSIGAGEIVFWGCVVGFLYAGVFGVAWAYTPESFPTLLRSTGAGLAAAFGRFGGTIAPLAVGLLLGNWSSNYAIIFGMFAAVLLMGGISIAVLGVETKGRSLEEIAG